MPIVSEKAASRQGVKSSISSQFWEQTGHSARSLDGQAWSLPCEPPPLALTGASGLSRTQQLLAAQATRVPFFPSYDGSSEGLVLDRVVAKAGGRRWWAALSGRVKAQRAYNLGASGAVRKVDAVRDLSNYALCARSRVQLGRRLTFNAVAEAPDVAALATRLRELHEQRRSAAAQASSSSGAGDASSGSMAGSSAGAGSSGGLAPVAKLPPVPELEPYTAHATLRCTLPGHDLTATAGYNLPYLDSGGDASHVPLAVSLDLSSHDRADGLQYRVGLHQVTAPPTEMPTRPGHAPQRWRTSLHAQGALAVEGEAHIWRGGVGKDKEGKEGGKEGGAPVAAGAAAVEAPAVAAPAKQQGTGSEEAGGGEEPRRGKLAPGLDRGRAADTGTAEQPAAAAAAADGGSSAVPAGSEQQQVGAAPAAGAPQASEAPAPEAAPGAAPPRQPSAALEAFMRPLEQMGERVSDMLHWSPQQPQQPQQQEQQEPAGTGEDSGYAAGSSSDVDASGAAEAQPAGSSASASSDDSVPRSPGGLLHGVSSESVTATIQDSVALLQRVKGSVERLTSNVQDGSLQRLSQQLADSRHAPQRRRPYSMLLAQPHFKLNAALGCLARMPLPPLRAFSFPQASLEPLEQLGGSGPRLLGAGGAHQRQSSNASLVSRASHSSHIAEAWQPYLKGTALRLFSSMGVSGQLGRFTRPWLDYTAASARVDVGLTSPHVVGVVPDPASLAAESAHRPDKHRAFALEGRGAWHALSVSLAQQVFGPVRARMDARFALDPTSVPASEGERSTVKGVLQTALSVRPSLLESAYGFDVVLPGSEGAARLAVWYSPKRRECMAELRLF